MRLVLVIAFTVLLTTACKREAGQIESQSSESKTLLEARGGFTTKLVRKETDGEPVPDPPPGVLRTVKYPSPAGELAAYVSPSPGDGKKQPAIIWIFGGFDNSIGDTAWEKGPPDNDQSASAFREARIIMMYPSLRGGNKNPGFKEGFYGEVDDILAALDYLGKQDYVDADRIYLGGHSTGGTLALLVAESTDRFRCVFAFGPVEAVGGYGADNLPFDISNRRELELRAPIMWLQAIRKPTFVFEGSKQPANVSSLRALSRAARNPSVHFHAVPGANHFSILAPITRLVASKIRRDDGPSSNITFTEKELSESVK